jgi:hypothetical protein
MAQRSFLRQQLLRNRSLLLAALILLPVEAASTTSLFLWYRFFEAPVPAALVATAFCTLQVTLLLLAAQPLRPSTHRWLLAGATVLFTLTLLANVGNAFLHADGVLPADRLASAMGFGLNARTFTVATAWFSGGAIPAVGLICWSALAQHLRNERDRAGDQREALRAALRALELGDRGGDAA